jgi:cell division protein FtsL
MSGKGLMVLTLIVTLLVSLFYVRSRFLIVELSYDVTQRQEWKMKLEQERRALTLELATLRNPKRMERIAAQRLGLERPTGMKSVVLVREENRDVR